MEGHDLRVPCAEPARRPVELDQGGHRVGLLASRCGCGPHRRRASEPRPRFGRSGRRAASGTRRRAPDRPAPCGGCTPGAARRDAVRWRWRSSVTSTSPAATARRTLIVSSSRGGASSTTGLTNQASSSTRPASVIRYSRRSSCSSPPAVLLDEAVALETLEGRVDLADVDVPRPARPALEGGLQLVAVGWRLREQRQQAVPNRHVSFLSSSSASTEHTYSVCIVQGSRGSLASQVTASLPGKQARNAADAIRGARSDFSPQAGRVHGISAAFPRAWCRLQPWNGTADGSGGRCAGAEAGSPACPGSLFASGASSVSAHGRSGPPGATARRGTRRRIEDPPFDHAQEHP